MRPRAVDEYICRGRGKPITPEEISECAEKYTVGDCVRVKLSYTEHLVGKVTAKTKRKNREVIDPIRIADIISRCTCCRIGFYDDGEMYIVPLNFGYEAKDNTYVFYFHGAKEGRKIDLIEKSSNVGFEMDTNYALNEADVVCGYSACFQSIVGNGIVSVVSNEDEKKLGLSEVLLLFTWVQMMNLRKPV